MIDYSVSARPNPRDREAAPTFKVLYTPMYLIIKISVEM